MKRNWFFIVTLLMIISNTTSAQVFLGGRAGLNMSLLALSDEIAPYSELTQPTPKLNANLALNAYFEIGPYFSIQPEFIYNRKGLKSKAAFDTGSKQDSSIYGELQYSFDYFEFPLMLKLSLNNEGFDPFFEFGAYYGYLIQAKYVSDIYLNDEKFISEDYKPSLTKPNVSGISFNRNEWGFKAGIGGMFKTNRGAFYFSIRYSQGLTDIFNYTEKTSSYEKSYNRVFQLNFGYLLELRKSNNNKIYYY
ncbi:MAG: PorT family protein [Bacteroidales bacterium]|nr:PorT family protein [Bacteroidales bacterium]